MVHHLTSKKAHVNGFIFFSKSILLIYFRANSKPTILSSDIGNLLFWSTMGMPGMPDLTQEKVQDRIAASMDILLHAKSKPST